MLEGRLRLSIAGRSGRLKLDIFFVSLATASASFLCSRTKKRSQETLRVIQANRQAQ